MFILDRTTTQGGVFNVFNVSRGLPEEDPLTRTSGAFWGCVEGAAPLRRMSAPNQVASEEHLPALPPVRAAQCFEVSQCLALINDA